MQDTLHAVLEDRARLSPNHPFLICPDETLSFSEAHRRAQRVARALRARGVGKGTVVTLWMENGWRWAICYFAILECGATANPVNVLLAADEVRFILADCGARLLIAGSERLSTLGHIDGVDVISDSPTQHAAATIDILLGSVEDEPAQTPDNSTPDDLATIGYTSGTTGRPRGAALAHKSIVLNAAMTSLMHGRCATDTVVSALPCTHVYGNIVLNAAVASGMSLVLLPRFDEEAVLSSIERHRATIFEGVPTMYVRLLNYSTLKRFNLSSLRLCTVGGQTMPAGQMEEVQRSFGCPLRELWGMTELGGLGATHPHNGPQKLGSIGVPLPTVEMMVVDPSDDTKVLGRGEPGELLVRGPLVMRGYLGDVCATNEAITPDGWLRTGDIARQDADGYYFIVDRKKDVIISGGYKVYPAEVERVIAELPAVAMVAVAPKKDPLKGHVPRAFVVLKAGCESNEAQIMAHCRGLLASYKIPKAIEFVGDLPRNSTGKILRRALAEALLVTFLLLSLGSPRSNANTSTGVPAAREFSLLDTRGHLVSEQVFLGRWLFVYFGFTRCADVCPGALLLLSQVLKQLGSAGSGIVPIFITIDSEHDTPRVIQEYLRHFDPRIVGLTGDAAQTAAAQRTFGVYSRGQAGGSDTLPAHTSIFYVINPQGGLERQLSSTMTADELTRFLRKSLGGTPPGLAEKGTAHD